MRFEKGKVSLNAIFIHFFIHFVILIPMSYLPSYYGFLYFSYMTSIFIYYFRYIPIFFIKLHARTVFVLIFIVLAYAFLYYFANDLTVNKLIHINFDFLHFMLVVSLNITIIFYVFYFLLYVVKKFISSKTLFNPKNFLIPIAILLIIIFEDLAYAYMYQNFMDKDVVDYLKNVYPDFPFDISYYDYYFYTFSTHYSVPFTDDVKLISIHSVIIGDGLYRLFQSFQFYFNKIIDLIIIGAIAQAIIGLILKKKNNDQIS